MTTKPKTTKEEISKRLAFVIGIGILASFYVISSIIFIYAFLRGGSITVIHTNVIGEAGLEFSLAILSIPFVIYTMKSSIDLHKKATR